MRWRLVVLLALLPSLAFGYDGQLSVSSRNLVDESGDAQYLNCDTPWALFAAITPEEVTTYFDALEADGFNCIMASLPEHEFSDTCGANGCENYDGELPFVGGDLAVRNPLYWAHADWVIATAISEYDLTLLLLPMYLGYDCGSEGWCSFLTGHDEADSYEYGQWLGTRYGDYDKIVWVAGGDVNAYRYAGAGERMNKIMEGIENTDPSALKTAHGERYVERSRTGRQAYVDDATGGYDTSWFDFDTAYTGNSGDDECVPHSGVHKQAYDDTPVLPVFVIEGLYENENENVANYDPPSCLRRQNWGALLDGMVGQAYGSNPIWPFDNAPGFCDSASTDCLGGWENFLDDTARDDMGWLNYVTENWPFGAMSPDWSEAFVTAGRGTISEDTYVPVLASTTHLVAYTPDDDQLTVAMSQLSGATYVHAAWYNPRTGVRTDIATYATGDGDQNFTPPTDDDWVLLVGKSLLQQAAESLAAGESIEIGTNGLWAAIFTDPCGTTSTNSYGQSGVWDVVRNEGRFVGKGPTGACGFYFTVYDAASNEWSNDRALPTALSNNQNGHMYDHNAVNPANGDQYFRAWGGIYTIHEWTSSTQTWSTPATIPSPVQSATPAETLTFFPDLGLVFVDSRGCKYWDLDSTWEDCTGDMIDDTDVFHVFSEWQPNANVMIFGGGEIYGVGPQYDLFSLDSSGVATSITDAPHNVGNGASSGGLVTADPSSTLFITHDKNTSTWYQYAPEGDDWSALSESSGSCTSPCTGLPQIRDHEVGGDWGAEMAISIPEYGVIMYIGSGTDAQNDVVWLYKHTEVGAAAPVSPLVTVTVKETSGVGATAWPTTVVLPLADGSYTTTSSLRLHDGTGTVPAQFEVLERDWIEDGTPDDNSILHVAAHFQATVGASATAAYTVGDDGGNTQPDDAVIVVDDAPSAGYIQVTTGPLRFTVRKTGGFNILDTVWYDEDASPDYADGDRIVLPSAAHGGRFGGCTGTSVETGTVCTGETQHDTALSDPECVIEESGPMRAVIRCEKTTTFTDSNNNGYAESHEHGYAVRIYAYAGKSYVKIDYQLQNSAKSGWDDSSCHGGAGTCELAGPLYFQSLVLEWDLELTGTVTVKTSDTEDGGDEIDSVTLDGDGVELAHTLHDTYQVRRADGTNDWVDRTNNSYSDMWLDTYDSTWGVQAVIRNGWETWPNGIEVTDSTDYTLQVQLWPEWSSQWDYSAGDFYDTPAAEPVYWLDDMRHVYKEVLLNFHGASFSDANRKAFAKTFDRYPVPSMPTEYYGSTAVTMDLGGVNPLSGGIGIGTLLETNSAGDLNEASGSSYRMGWDRWFTSEIARLEQPSATGGGPPAGDKFIATEDPGDYWDAERQTISLLNSQPQWMADYTHAGDWATLGITQEPYAGEFWRANMDGSPCPEYGCYSYSGSEKVNAAFDDQHGWFYQTTSYWTVPNLWLKDWMSFLGEFRRQRMLDDERYPDRTGRGIGHAMKDTVGAYRVTGTNAYLTEAVDYMHDTLTISALCGQYTGSDFPGDVVYSGYQNRPLADIAERLKGRDWDNWAKAFRYLSSQMYGLYLYGHLQYHGALCSPTGGSSETGWHNPDSLAWYYWMTGKSEFHSWSADYISTGIGYCSNNNLQVCNGSEDCGGQACSSIGANALVSPADSANFMDQPTWIGDWAGRAYEYVDNASRPDATPPNAPASVAAELDGGTLTVTWTAPVADEEYYYVVWADRAVVEAHSTDTTNYQNWWYAEPHACSAVTCNGVAVITGATGATHVGVFAFDEADNMSVMSAAVVGEEASPTVKSVAGGTVNGGVIK